MTTSDGPKPTEFYGVRYSPERQRLKDQVFAEVYDDYFGQSSWVSTADYDRFIGWLEVTTSSRVLDIACGAGQPALRLVSRTGCSVVGIDSSKEAIARAIALAKQRGLSSKALFECADAGKQLAFDDCSLDAVVCIDALSHLADHPSVFAEWARILKPQGRVVFTDQVLTGSISNHEVAARSPHGHFLLVLDGYDAKELEKAGFEIVRHVDITSTFAAIAARHCAARTRHADALRSVEGDEDFEVQNRYRTTAETLAKEKRLSHFAFLARKR